MQLSFLIQLVLLLLLTISVYLVFTNTVEGRTKLILIVFCVVLGVYLFSKFNLFKDYNEFISTPMNARYTFTIEESLLKESDGQFAISSWIFIDDWNYRYGEEKIILKKELPSDRGAMMNVPKISLDPYKNDLIIDLDVFGDEEDTFQTLLKKEIEDNDTANTFSQWTDDTNTNYSCKDNVIIIHNKDIYDTGSSSTTTTSESSSSVKFTQSSGEIKTNISCVYGISQELIVENINMQKWVNIILTVNNRSMDVYINGKLVKTKAFNNLIDTEAFNNGGITITPNGGFGGFVSRVQYYPYYINPEKAWNIYRDGFGDAFESSLNKYNMSMSFYKDSVEQNKFYVF